MLAAASGTAPLILDCRAGHDDPAGGVARYIGRASPTVVAAVLVGIAGVSGYP